MAKEIKSGVKTSEFYVSLATSIIGILLAKGVLTPEIVSEVNPYLENIQQIVGAIVVMFANANYIKSRNMAKR